MKAEKRIEGLQDYLRGELESEDAYLGREEMENLQKDIDELAKEIKAEKAAQQ